MYNYRAMTEEEKCFLIKGSQWKHRNGCKYTVVGVANTRYINPDYPIVIIYVGRNGHLWAKTLNDFMEKMSPFNG